MKRALLGLLVACMSLGFASVAMAGENANAGISLHLTMPKKAGVDCTSFNWRLNNPDPFRTKGQPCSHGDAEFDVWIVVCNGSDSVGVAGAEFGITYDPALGSGVDVVNGSWQLCADLEFPTGGAYPVWPKSGSGNLVTWDYFGNCQLTNLFPGVAKTAYAVVGVMSVRVRGEDELAIGPRPASGRMKVADCQAIEDDLTNAVVGRGGKATFCTNRNGYNFCKLAALAGTESTTWGKVKSMYGTN